MKIALVLGLGLGLLSTAAAAVGYSGEDSSPNVFTSPVSAIVDEYNRSEDPNLQDVILLRCAAVQFTKQNLMEQQGRFSQNDIQTMHLVGDFFYSRLVHRRIQGVGPENIAGQIIIINAVSDLINQNMAVYNNHITQAGGDIINEPMVSGDSRYCYTLMESMQKYIRPTLF